MCLIKIYLITFIPPLLLSISNFSTEKQSILHVKWTVFGWKSSQIPLKKRTFRVNFSKIGRGCHSNHDQIMHKCMIWSWNTMMLRNFIEFSKFSLSLTRFWSIFIHFGWILIEFLWISLNFDGFSRIFEDFALIFSDFAWFPTDFPWLWVQLSHGARLHVKWDSILEKFSHISGSFKISFSDDRIHIPPPLWIRIHIPPLVNPP